MLLNLQSKALCSSIRLACNIHHVNNNFKLRFKNYLTRSKDSHKTFTFFFVDSNIGSSPQKSPWPQLKKENL